MTWPAEESDIPVRDVTPVDGHLTYDEGIHVGYRAWLKAGRQPAFPFGHGMGYTEWEVSDLTATSLSPRGSSEVSVQVANVGTRRGKCVIQFYLERVSASSVQRPVRWLAGFETMRLGAGEVKSIRTLVPWRCFAHWEAGSWRVEPGEYRLVSSLTSAETEISSPIVITDGQFDDPVVEPSVTRVHSGAQVADGVS